MSAQGVFINDDEVGFEQRPKSKKQLKDLIAAGKLNTIYVEAVNLIGPEQYAGPVTKEILEEQGEITFVGPSPYNARNFFGQFYVDKKGAVNVK